MGYIPHAVVGKEHIYDKGYCLQYSIAIDEEGYIAISEGGNHNCLWIYHPDHSRPVNTIPYFNNPVGVVCDAEGVFWIADSGNSRIQQTCEPYNIMS